MPGQKVVSKRVQQSETINVANMPRGVYLYTLSHGTTCTGEIDQEINNTRTDYENSFFLIIAAFFMMAPFFLLTSCDKEDDEDVTIQVYGVEFTPNILEDAGGLAGIEADITAEAMQQAGITYEMNLSESFPSAYNAALAGPNKAMMSVGYTPNERPVQMAGPTSQSMYGIFERELQTWSFRCPLTSANHYLP
jgi:hypothetical protein